MLTAPVTAIAQAPWMDLPELAAEDFVPPLNRGEAEIPHYWTVQELSLVTGRSVRSIYYDIKGRTAQKGRNEQPPTLAARFSNGAYFVPDYENFRSPVYKYIAYWRNLNGIAPLPAKAMRSKRAFTAA